MYDYARLANRWQWILPDCKQTPRVIGFRAAAVKRRTINTLNAYRQICRAMINAIDRMRGDAADDLIIKPAASGIIRDICSQMNFMRRQGVKRSRSHARWVNWRCRDAILAERLKCRLCPHDRIRGSPRKDRQWLHCDGCIDCCIIPSARV